MGETGNMIVIELVHLIIIEVRAKREIFFGEAPPSIFPVDAPECHDGTYSSSLWSYIEAIFILLLRLGLQCYNKTKKSPKIWSKSYENELNGVIASKQGGGHFYSQIVVAHRAYILDRQFSYF